MQNYIFKDYRLKPGHCKLYFINFAQAYCGVCIMSFMTSFMLLMRAVAARTTHPGIRMNGRRAAHKVIQSNGDASISLFSLTGQSASSFGASRGHPCTGGRHFEAAK
jgi:hypothetical protein